MILPERPSRAIGLPVAILERIDEICTRFEQQWRNDGRPDLRDYVAGAGVERIALFRELLKLDLEYRLKRGEQPAADDYRQRFPAEAGSMVFESLLFEPGGGHDAAAAVSWPGAAPAALPGKLARYRIERILGQGNFGTVYLAEDLELRRFVALKVAHEARHGRGDVDASLAEARALASLDHPAIIPVYDVGRAEGRSYIVTKLITGSNLSERLRQGLADHREAARWVAAIARGLQAAHDAGLVHRDVKPSNIMITSAGAAYIGDFGLALSEEQVGDGPRLLGTPAYMSPEQARGQGHRADARSDVFSLGAVLYELLTGRPPFKAENVSQTLRQVLEHDPVPPLRLSPTVGRDLDTICLKCLEKSPEKRYATAAALADDLERYLAHRSIRARPTGPFEKLVRWSRRDPLLAAALATTALTFLIAFVLVSGSYVRADRALREESRQRREAQRRERSERWERYRSNLMTTASVLHVGNVDGAREALDTAPREYRNWEWRYFVHQLDRADNILPAPDAGGLVCFSGDASKAVLMSDVQPPRLLDIRARTQRGPLSIASPAVDARWNADGRLVALLGADGTIVVWDVPADRERARWRAPERGVKVWRLSADGARLAVACPDRTVRVVDAATGQERLCLRGHEDVPLALAFSPDSRRLASAGANDRTVRLWDLSDGRPLAVLRHEGSAVSALFDPAGKRLLTGEAYPNNLLRVWDATTGEPVSVLRGHINEALCWAFSRDGGRIATGGYDQTVRLWDAQTGALQSTLRGHKGWVLGVDFSPDGRRVATTGRDRTLRLWDAATGENLAVAPTYQVYRVTRFAPDGATIVAGGEGPVRFWNVGRLERGGVLRGHTKSIYDVAFHPDGRRVASASWDGTVRVWDATTGDALRVLSYPGKTIVTGVAFHPDGTLLASVGRDDCVRLWDPDSGRQVGRLSLPAAGNRDARVAFSRNGDLLACGCRDDSGLCLWRVGPRPQSATGGVDATEVAVLRGQDVANDVAFGREGRWLAVAEQGAPGRVRIWPVAGGGPPRILEGHTNDVLSLAVSRDGRWLASGSADGTVRLWDTAGWTEAAVLFQGPQVYGVAFSPDGARLACGCGDGTIWLYDTATRKRVCVLEGHGQFVHQVEFSPDGTRLVSGSGDDTVRVWDSLSPAERSAKP